MAKELFFQGMPFMNADVYGKTVQNDITPDYETWLIDENTGVLKWQKNDMTYTVENGWRLPVIGIVTYNNVNYYLLSKMASSGEGTQFISLLLAKVSTTQIGGVISPLYILIYRRFCRFIRKVAKMVSSLYMNGQQFFPDYLTGNYKIKKENKTIPLYLIDTNVNNTMTVSKKENADLDLSKVDTVYDSNGSYTIYGAAIVNGEKYYFTHLSSGDNVTFVTVVKASDVTLTQNGGVTKALYRLYSKLSRLFATPGKAVA